MGIKNLLKFLSEKSTTQENNIILKNVEPNQYYGKKVAIDISILMYQVVIAIRNSGSDLMNEKGEITSHILGLFNKTISFLDKGIIPIYVFDGKPPQLKQKILDARKNVKRKAMEKLETEEEISEFDRIKYFKRCVTITREQMDQCRELLQYMGVPYVDAPEEADSQLAYLCKTNMVYAVLTEDMDILTFGSPRIIRNLTTNKKQPLEIELSNILSSLDLTYEQFIDICILFGCDYCPSLIDIKTSQIYDVYMKHKNIEMTIMELKDMGYNVPDNIEYMEAKQYFINSVYNKQEHEFKLMQPNIDMLLSLLVDKYGLIKYKIIIKLQRLVNHYLIFKELTI
jgi:flap endonuclease-1